KGWCFAVIISENPQEDISEDVPSAPLGQMDLQEGLEELFNGITSQGYIYQPWQLAQYVTALRTKPFVILAGISGTGKSKLPQLVAERTGGESRLIPVRPDWTDSAEVLGYTDLQGAFRPGPLLELAHSAMDEDHSHWICILDEMNLARVEHYFAEVLSQIEDRRPATGGGYRSSPLIQNALQEEDAEWGRVRLPPNLALVGTVNMDESAHGFSRKVLDRAFTIELSEVDLDNWKIASSTPQSIGNPWPVSWWWPRASRLSELKSYTEAEEKRIQQSIDELSTLNRILSAAQLQVGYRTRDEIALFILHAEEVRDFFQTREENAVDPLDLAFQMKILPRIVGGSGGIQRVLLGLMGWSFNRMPLEREEDAHDIMDSWEKAERPEQLFDARYPGLASRSCLMWDRLLSEGFTSYWL
ncbi:MAG: McrB family protein, partial [Thermodesulfobacteriota bacterium]